MENLYFILPEIFLSLSIMFLLIIGVFKNNSSKLVHNLSLIVMLITTVIIFNETIGIDQIFLFNGSVIIDYLSSFMKMVSLLSAFIVLAISNSYLKVFNHYI